MLEPAPAHVAHDGGPVKAIDRKMRERWVCEQSALASGSFEHLDGAVGESRRTDGVEQSLPLLDPVAQQQFGQILVDEEIDHDEAAEDGPGITLQHATQVFLGVGDGGRSARIAVFGANGNERHLTEVLVESGGNVRNRLQLTEEYLRPVVVARVSPGHRSELQQSERIV